MLTLQITSPTRKQDQHYSVSLARSSGEIEEAQRLRYRVFMEEMGAASPDLQRLDIDDFDADCEHLIVRDQASLWVVGCYRIMRPEIAQRRGAYYADGEFDLTRLHHLRNQTAELGRACIDPAHRNGTVLMLLWSALGRIITEAEFGYVIGCASISLATGHDNVLAVFNDVATKHLSPPEYRVFPRVAYPIRAPAANAATLPRTPPLLKGYTRMGAWICGEPAWDADFNTADLLILLPVARVSKAYARHFFGHALAA